MVPNCAKHLIGNVNRDLVRTLLNIYDRAFLTNQKRVPTEKMGTYGGPYHTDTGPLICSAN